MDFNTGNWLIGMRSLQEQKEDAEPTQTLVSVRRGWGNKGEEVVVPEPSIWRRSPVELVVWSFGERSLKLVLRPPVWQVPGTLWRGHSLTDAQKSVLQCVREYRAISPSSLSRRHVLITHRS